MTLRRLGCLVLTGGALIAACKNKEPADAAPPAAPATPAPSAASTVVPPIVASARNDAPDCVTAAESMKRAKPHLGAAAPYADCAASVMAHCEPDRMLCSHALDVEATRRERNKTPDACCYRN